MLEIKDSLTYELQLLSACHPQGKKSNTLLRVLLIFSHFRQTVIKERQYAHNRQETSGHCRPFTYLLLLLSQAPAIP